MNRRRRGGCPAAQAALATLLLMAPLAACRQAAPPQQQPYRLTKTHDSLYHLNEWALPYPVYRFATGDVDGDGHDDALVGVVKATRFHHEVGRRLLVFKQVNGKVRPLWMGSSLGGRLIDFRLNDGRIRALEQKADGHYAVTDYAWQGFGPGFHSYIVNDTDYTTALKHF